MLIFSGLTLALLGTPAFAQDSEVPTPTPAAVPAVLEQAEKRLQELSPSQAQSQEMIGLLLRYLPRLLDDRVDPAALAREIQPEAENLLTTDQKQTLRQFQDEFSTTPLGTMSREERRRLIQGGLERLSHPDTQEWLKRIDSFDI